MHVLNLGDKLKVPAVKRQETAAEKTAQDQAEEEKRQKLMFWYELVQCLDKGSINFIRLSKPGGVTAWRALVGKNRSTDKPCIPTLLIQMIT